MNPECGLRSVLRTGILPTDTPLLVGMFLPTLRSCYDARPNLGGELASPQPLAKLRPVSEKPLPQANATSCSDSESGRQDGY